LDGKHTVLRDRRYGEASSRLRGGWKGVRKGAVSSVFGWTLGIAFELIMSLQPEDGWSGAFLKVVVGTVSHWTSARPQFGMVPFSLSCLRTTLKPHFHVPLMSGVQDEQWIAFEVPNAGVFTLAIS
jgi:hypothetical protein